MNTWTPLWSGVVESSLWDLPDFVVKVFLTMLSVKDADHVVRRNAYAIGKLSRKSEQEVLDALKILSSPDTVRVEKQDYEGRRIEAVEDGWLILNGEKYRAKVQEVMLKSKNMRASANFRARQVGKPEPYPKRPLTAKQQESYEKGRAKVKKKPLTLREAEILGRKDGIAEALDQVPAQSPDAFLNIASKSAPGGLSVDLVAALPNNAPNPGVLPDGGNGQAGYTPDNPEPIDPDDDED